MVSLSNGEVCNGVLNKRHFEETHGSSLITPKWKRRKVSAVRDFPPGCGPNAPRILAKPVDDEKKKEVSSANGVKVSENGNELLSREEVNSPSELEMGGLLDDLVGKVVASAAMPVNGDDMSSSIKPLGDDFWQTLQIDAPEFSHDFDKVETPAVVKKGEVEISPVVQDLPISNGNVVNDPSVKTKYPRRRVSATRDFPPFCGRNAPCPTEEEREQIRLGASHKGEVLERKRGEREESELDVDNENKNTEEFENVVPRVISETPIGEEQGGPTNNIVNNVVNASLASETRGPGFGKLHGDVRESGSPKIKVIVHEAEQKTKSEEIKRTDNKEEKDVSKEDVVFADKTGDISDLGDYASSSEEDEEMEKGFISGASSITWQHSDTHNKKAEKINPVGISSKKKSSVAQVQGEGDNSVGTSSGKKPASSRKLVAKKKGLVSQNNIEVSYAGLGAKELEVTLPPFGPSCSAGNNMRNRVRDTLRTFQAVCRKILQGEEANSNKQKKASKRIDLDAAKVIKQTGKEVNTETQIIGSVPGVEVGDEFVYRVELALVGVHRLYQAGIDYKMHNGISICVSIVASGGYADELDDPDVLIYSGQGGVPGGRNKGKQAEDQKLEKGNLALKNSITVKNPVRVIRGTKEKVAKLDARSKVVPSYAYDGLYHVEKYWQEVGHNGKLVFKFELRRIPGQPELAWKEVKKSKKFKSREGVCVEDISNGKEPFRICAVNTVDNEKPPAFKYITKMIYPSWYSPTPPEGCGCVGGCSDSQKCSCVIKNGEEIPYNHNGAIVEAKPLVHECGPSCKCPPSCPNRVAQHGMKIQLEIFKTESRGWGVRSLSSIPSGSFICEYLGELLDDKEAEKRSNDEYLFDIGQNYTDCQQLSSQSSAEVVEDSGFTIDAAVYGNVGRFINHSCSPNLYAQNVLFDHEDRSMPHIMLFAAENIPALQEITYHYNYKIDQVHDSNGNIKKKSCYCGSEECTGRMY